MLSNVAFSELLCGSPKEAETRMKLWILRPNEHLPDGTESPWEPWYDKAFGFVVRAETEDEARQLANDEGGDECGPVTHTIYRTGGNPWLDPAFSTCEELTADGAPGVVIQDFHAA